VDALFDSVMVMDENLEIRHNRLSLLRAIANDFKQIADFTILSA
jgi:glycyl-tRNA synthetase beta subunit